MICPYCSEEMRSGYVQGARGVIFSEYEKVVFVVKNPFSKKDVKITGTFEYTSPAFYCDNCQMMIWKKEFSE